MRGAFVGPAILTRVRPLIYDVGSGHVFVRSNALRVVRCFSCALIRTYRADRVVLRVALVFPFYRLFRDALFQVGFVIPFAVNVRGATTLVQLRHAGGDVEPQIR